MSGEKISLESLARELLEQKRREHEPRASLEELEQYAAGELDREAIERVRDEIAVDPESRQIVLELLELADPAPPEGVRLLDHEEVEAAWQRVERKLREP